MDIHREGKFLIGSDLQGRVLVGIESRRLNDCISEAKRRRAYGVFGTPSLGFREDTLDFLSGITNTKHIWFWEIELKNIEGIYALTNLRYFGVHDKRPAIDFSRLRKLEEVQWCYNRNDSGLQSLRNMRALHIWHYNEKRRSFEGLELPTTIEELSIVWANPSSLAGLPELPRVRRLRITRMPKLESIAELTRITPNVEHLVVSNCSRVADGKEVVRRLPKLQHAFVRDAVLVTEGRLKWP